jgi:beta-catenin-like protein 1
MVKMLNRKNKSLKNIVSTLKVYHDNIDDEATGRDSEMEVDRKESETTLSQRDILKGLMTYLESC